MRRSVSLLLPVLLGCATAVPPPKVDLAGKDPHAAWTRVLRRFVDADGRIDFAAMGRDSADLDTYVAWVAECDPASRPAAFVSDADRLAYHLNTYNALAMYNVLHAGVLPEATADFFYFRELMIGGRWISLYHYENEVIRPLGEERVHFGLNCMVRACPRLPQTPFTAASLDAQLDAAAREFFNKDLHVEVRPGERKVRFSQILEFYTDDFLAAAPSLIAYCNRYRDAPVPADYTVEFIPYDWTLNQR